MHSANTPFSIRVIEDGISIRLREEHWLKAALQIFVKEEGIVIESKDEQFRNVLVSIEVIKDGIFISFNEEHSAKAPPPIFATEEGIVIEDKDSHP